MNRLPYMITLAFTADLNKPLFKGLIKGEEAFSFKEHTSLPGCMDTSKLGNKDVG